MGAHPINSLWMALNKKNWQFYCVLDVLETLLTKTHDYRASPETPWDLKQIQFVFIEQ